MARFLSNEDGSPEEAGVLEVERDGQWVYSSLPQPDLSWNSTDSNGHEHAYADGADHYPSLRLEHGEPYWCAECDDEHTDSWYVCRLCGEQVSPGTRVDPNPTWVAGPTVYRLDGEEITPERAQAIQERHAQSQPAKEGRSSLSLSLVKEAERAMRQEGLTEEQIRRVVDRMEGAR